MIYPKHKPNGIIKADAEAQKAENLINQDFTAEDSNTKWLTDITKIPLFGWKIVSRNDFRLLFRS